MVAPPFNFFRTKRNGNIPAGTSPNEGVESRLGMKKVGIFDLLLYL